MAELLDSIDSRHGTSDEYIDPFCDTCYESEGRNVRVCGFCKDCVQFLCSGCYNVHRKLQGCRHHDVIHGEDMPKSQADKPPRFEYCDAHPKLLKNQFCCAHKVLLCSVCSSADHEGCSIKSVEDVSGTVDASETGALYDKIKYLQENMNRGGIATLLPISPEQMSKIKAAKKGTYNVKMKDDKITYFITGMAITKDRRLLMVDRINSKVKMFSHDMKFLSSVLVADVPYDIVVLSDNTAAVTADKTSLVILDISSTKLSIRTTAQVSFDLRGISRYNKKLVVTSQNDKPPSVKLIDQTGRVYWSVSSDQQGKPLFSSPWHVSSPGDGRSSTVIVTDSGNNTLTLLNGDTGEVITRRQLKEKLPEGVTTDSDGNVYVCYFGTSEVAVLSGDLSEEKILLSRQDGLSGKPRAIVYNDTTHQLIISYFNFLGLDSVDCFQLS